MYVFIEYFTNSQVLLEELKQTLTSRFIPEICSFITLSSDVTLWCECRQTNLFFRDQDHEFEICKGSCSDMVTTILLKS